MPAIRRIEASGRYVFAFLDYDLYPDLVKKYRIKRIPTYLVVGEDGRVTYRTTKIKNLE